MLLEHLVQNSLLRSPALAMGTPGRCHVLLCLADSWRSREARRSRSKHQEARAPRGAHPSATRGRSGFPVSSGHTQAAFVAIDEPNRISFFSAHTGDFTSVATNVVAIRWICSGRRSSST